MTADRKRAARIQALYVRLLFCDETYDRYRTDRPGLAAAFDLDERALDALPKAGAGQLISERKGRRIGALNEIQAVFAQSYGLLEKRSDYQVGEFLCSDAFFDPGSGLPHPYGSGPGYENASKFYFWVRETLSFGTGPKDMQTRMMLNGDFAAHLIARYADGSDTYFQRFSKGICWREAVTGDLPLIFVSAERHVYRIGDAKSAKQTLSSLPYDLDSLRPEPAPTDENPL